MSSFPPPGDAPGAGPGPGAGGEHPPPGSPGPAPAGDQAYGGRPASARTAPTPGTVPLRPLGLGDMFDGAFRTIRRNPGATLGVAFLVNLVFLVIPVAGLGVLSLLGEIGPLVPDVSTLDAGGGDQIGSATLVSGLLSAVSSLLAGVVVTGLVVQVVARSAIGERLGAQEAWRRTRPRLWALLGLTLLSTLVPLLVVGLVAGIAVGVALGVGTVAGVLVAVALGVAAVVGIVWFWTRFLLLAPCVLVLEQSSVRVAVRRSRELSRGSFWRLFGTYLLISLAAYVLASLVTIPLAVLSLGSLFLVGDQTLGTVLVLLLDNLGTVVSGALATPFVGAVVALQYLDVRIRREGLDVRLQQQAAAQRSGGTVSDR